MNASLELNTRVLLVEEQILFREAVSAILVRELGLRDVIEAGTADEALGRLGEFDLAIVSSSLPNGGGLELVRELRGADASRPIIVLTSSADRHEIAMAVEAGATGVLTTASRLGDVIDTIRRACAGEALIPPQETIQLLRLAGRQRTNDYAAREMVNRLTHRELEILQILADGLSDREIAERLHISTETVRTHFVNILSKLGVGSRIQALVFALRYGIAEIRKSDGVVASPHADDPS